MKTAKIVFTLIFFCCVTFFPSQIHAEPERKSGSWINELGNEIGQSLEYGARWLIGLITGQTPEEMEREEQEAKKQERQEQARKNRVVGVPGGTLIDSLFDIGNQPKKVGRVVAAYNAYPLSHYELDLYLDLDKIGFFDLDKQATAAISYQFYRLYNTIWMCNVTFSRMVVYFLETSLTLDLVDKVGKSISNGLKKMAGFEGLDLSDRGVYGLLFPLMITLLGFWVGWRSLAQDDSEGATRGLINSLVVIFASFTFFYFSQNIITTANKISSDLSKGVMAISINVFNPNQKTLSSNESTVEVGNNLWSVMVFQPYLLLQYGDTIGDAERVHALLKHSPSSQGRANQVQKEVNSPKEGGYGNKSMTYTNDYTRLGFTILVVILNLFVGVIVLIVSAGMPFFQIYFMFTLFMAPIALAWAIVPAWRNSMYSWASEALGALFMKLALGMMLSIFFAFSSALYSQTKEQGYMLTMFVQLLLIILLIWKRDQLFELVTSPVQFMTGKMPGGAKVLDDVLKTGARLMGHQRDENLQKIPLMQMATSKQKPNLHRLYSQSSGKSSDSKSSQKADNRFDFHSDHGDDDRKSTPSIVTKNSNVTSDKPADDSPNNPKDPDGSTSAAVVIENTSPKKDVQVRTNKGDGSSPPTSQPQLTNLYEASIKKPDAKSDDEPSQEPDQVLPKSKGIPIKYRLYSKEDSSKTDRGHGKDET